MSDELQRIVVIGASAAGLRAAARTRRLLPGVEVVGIAYFETFHLGPWVPLQVNCAPLVWLENHCAVGFQTIPCVARGSSPGLGFGVM